MFGLRQKLFFGFGGLLVILLAVSSLGVAVLNQHRTWLDRFLYENWRSVEYGQHMLDALPPLNSIAQSVSGENGQPTNAEITPPRPPPKSLRDIFDPNVIAEDHNITLPTEDVIASELTRLWSGYEINTHTGEPTGKSTNDSYIDQLNKLLMLHDLAAPTVRRRSPRSSIISPQLKDRAQEVIDLNFENMQPLEGRIKDMSDNATQLIKRLAVVGVGLAIVLILLMSRAILKPLQALTRSLEEIAAGNLDQVVQVKSRDELHKLAEAFNSMAAKLREFRRTDRAKLDAHPAHDPARHRQPARRHGGRQRVRRRRDFQRNRPETVPALSGTIGPFTARPAFGRAISAGRPRRAPPRSPGVTNPPSKSMTRAVNCAFSSRGPCRLWMPSGI